MDLDRLLRRAVELGATDIHLKLGLPPVIRRDGELGPIPDELPLTAENLARAVDVIGASAPSRLDEFRHSGDLDVAYQSDGLPRFRVNAFRQRGAISFAFRVRSA